MPPARTRMAKDELRVGFGQLRPGASRDTASWKATASCALGFGTTAVSRHVNGGRRGHHRVASVGDQVKGHAPAGFAPAGWDVLRAIGHSYFSGPFARRTPSVVPMWSPERMVSPQGHQRPPPGMGPWGLWPVTSGELSHALSPRNPATRCRVSPKRHPPRCDTPPPPTSPRAGERPSGTTRRVLLGGPSLPFHRRGKPKHREL